MTAVTLRTSNCCTWTEPAVWTGGPNKLTLGEMFLVLSKNVSTRVERGSNLNPKALLTTAYCLQPSGVH